MVKTKGKTAKKEGVKKHQAQEKAKKRAAKERGRVQLPDKYKKK
jgi:hypothetical protein